VVVFGKARAAEITDFCTELYNTGIRQQIGSVV